MCLEIDIACMCTMHRPMPIVPSGFVVLPSRFTSRGIGEGPIGPGKEGREGSASGPAMYRDLDTFRLTY
jgi:hypothetical protein